jgi:hypothetical protein
MTWTRAARLLEERVDLVVGLRQSRRDISRRSGSGHRLSQRRRVIVIVAAPGVLVQELKAIANSEHAPLGLAHVAVANALVNETVLNDLGPVKGRIEAVLTIGIQG